MGKKMVIKSKPRGVLKNQTAQVPNQGKSISLRGALRVIEQKPQAEIDLVKAALLKY